LLQIDGALKPSSDAPHFLHCRQKQAYQHPNDGNNHQEFDQSKAFLPRFADHCLPNN